MFAKELAGFILFCFLTMGQIPNTPYEHTEKDLICARARKSILFLTWKPRVTIIMVKAVLVSGRYSQKSAR